MAGRFRVGAGVDVGGPIVWLAFEDNEGKVRMTLRRDEAAVLVGDLQLAIESLPPRKLDG